MNSIPQYAREENYYEVNEPLPQEYIDRFTTKNGIPSTWGEAIQLRIGKQKASFRNNNSMGGWNLDNQH